MIQLPQLQFGCFLELNTCSFHHCSVPVVLVITFMAMLTFVLVFLLSISICVCCISLSPSSYTSCIFACIFWSDVLTSTRVRQMVMSKIISETSLYSSSKFYQWISQCLCGWTHVRLGHVSANDGIYFGQDP